MKKLFAASLIVLAAIGPAAADEHDLGSDWIPMPAIMLRAYALGFTAIAEIEAEQGVWKVKGFKDGVYTKIALDPHTGDVVPLPRKHKH